MSLVDADEVRHGRWEGKPIAGYSTVRCSECGEAFMENSGKWNYCPNCGAKMDEMKVNNSKGIDLWMTKEDFNSLYEDDVEDGV